MDKQSNAPIPTDRLKTICTQSCDSALSTATSYAHDSTSTWNNDIIGNILKALISETSTSDTSSEETEKPSTKYKFAVNSTIIQHLSDPGEGSGDGGKAGRRGMHSASAAYWNNERDGMWSFKYEGGERRGMDVVVSVMWIAL